MPCYAENDDQISGRVMVVRICPDGSRYVVSRGIVDFSTAKYKIAQGYFDPLCDCPTSTSKPVISYVQAAVSYDNQKVRLSWNQNISGNVKITKNGVVIRQDGYPAGDNFIDDPISPGTHTLCVEAT